MEYEFNGRLVYVYGHSFDLCPNVSDVQSFVADEDCNTICALGGIAGTVECEGINFEDNAELRRIVYEKNQ